MKTNNSKVFFRYNEDQSITAKVVNLKTNQEIADRTVSLRHGDRPNKIVGRKYAFKKLMSHVLQNHLLPGPEVEALWKTFGSTCKQPNFKLV